MGLSDAVRTLQPNGKVYTFWAYQAGAWPCDVGLRIDHVLLPSTLTEAAPDRRERGEEKASDYVSVVVWF
jgi:exodeoxyribonuclease-3